MTQRGAQAVFSAYVASISTNLLGGQPFVALGDLPVTTLFVDPNDTSPLPNGNPTADAVEGGASYAAGILVNAAFLNIADDNAIKFALGHELGHLFGTSLLTNLGFSGISGPRTEIIADLGAAYVMLLNGVTWEQINAVARQGSSVHNIFDVRWSGDHPPGWQRATFVYYLGMQMGGKTTVQAFSDAVKAIMTECDATKYPQGAATPPKKIADAVAARRSANGDKP